MDNVNSSDSLHGICAAVCQDLAPEAISLLTGGNGANCFVAIEYGTITKIVAEFHQNSETVRTTHPFLSARPSPAER